VWPSHPPLGLFKWGRSESANLGYAEKFRPLLPRTVPMDRLRLNNYLTDAAFANHHPEPKSNSGESELGVRCGQHFGPIGTSNLGVSH
jgi:hypothetical protein